MWKFSMQADETDFTHLLCSYGIAQLLVHTPYYPGVGYCVVYSCMGLSTTFDLVNENRLHTFFIFTNNHIWSSGGIRWTLLTIN